jgi:hypothetical protein
MSEPSRSGFFWPQPEFIFCLATDKNKSGRHLPKEKHERIYKKAKRIVEMHQPGIEPGASAWQAEILPLNH